MKKIVIMFAFTTYNYGSFMMVINFIEYISSLSGDKRIKFLVNYDTDDDLERLKIETSGKYDIKRLVVKNVSLKKYHRNIISVLNAQIKDGLIEKPDAIVYLGGDSLSEYYRGWRIIEEMYKIYKFSKASKVFLLGQTIGPFKWWREKVASFCFRNCYIYSRDAKSYEYVKNKLNLKNIFKFQDLALLDLPRQNDKELKSSILKKYGLVENEYITVVPSGASEQYTESFEDYIKSWVKIVTRLVNNTHLKDKKIVLLSHVSRPDYKSDGRIIRHILDKLDSTDKDRIVSIDKELLATDARIILGFGLVTLGSRMHSVISTLQMSKPAIALSYSVKYAGVIGEEFKMKELVIESRGKSIWENEKLIDEINRKIEYVFDNYDQVRKVISCELEKNKKIIIERLQEIVKIIG